MVNPFCPELSVDHLYFYKSLELVFGLLPIILLQLWFPFQTYSPLLKSILFSLSFYPTLSYFILLFNIKYTSMLYYKKGR